MELAERVRGVVLPPSFISEDPRRIGAQARGRVWSASKAGGSWQKQNTVKPVDNDPAGARQNMVS